jgi:hypothetical protein
MPFRNGSNLSTFFTQARNTLPRSANSRRRIVDHQQPPWNPSTLIDSDGFLTGLYARTPGDWEQTVRLRTAHDTSLPCQIRQVPGDGNCLFHSLSLALHYAVNGTHWDIVGSSTGLQALCERSRWLRAQAVATLRAKSGRLFLQGRETLRPQELVVAAAQQYDLTPEEYCTAMEEECVWGGGPEIVALCNILQRPIHVYELAVDDGRENDDVESDDSGGFTSGKKNVYGARSTVNGKPCFILRRMACFGSPRFDRQEALHILSADSRFPDLSPGHQLSAGNHFLAVFPQQRRRRKRLRGGGAEDDVSFEIVAEEKGSTMPRFLRWCREVVRFVVD